MPTLANPAPLRLGAALAVAPLGEQRVERARVGRYPSQVLAERVHHPSIALQGCSVDPEGLQRPETRCVMRDDDGRAVEGPAQLAPQPVDGPAVFAIRDAGMEGARLVGARGLHRIRQPGLGATAAQPGREGGRGVPLRRTDVLVVVHLQPGLLHQAGMPFAEGGPQGGAQETDTVEHDGIPFQDAHPGASCRRAGRFQDLVELAPVVLVIAQDVDHRLAGCGEPGHRVLDLADVAGCDEDVGLEVGRQFIGTELPVDVGEHVQARHRGTCDQRPEFRGGGRWHPDGMEEEGTRAALWRARPLGSAAGPMLPRAPRY